MANSFAIGIGVIGGIVAAAQVVASAVKRIKKANRTKMARGKQVHELSRLVREQAKTTLELRQEERGMKAELEALNGSIAQGERQISLRKAVESYLYVFDDRKAPGDTPFVVQITHANFGSLSKGAPEEVCADWRAGRRYMVWAASPKAALAKAVNRHPADKGYRVAGGEPLGQDIEDV